MSEPYNVNIDNSSNACLYRKFYQHPFLEGKLAISLKLLIVGKKNNYTTRFGSSFSIKNIHKKVSLSYI